MTRLDELRRRFPVAEHAAYRRAYAEAERTARLGQAVHALRERAGWTRAELADRAGISEDAVVLAEEGDASAAGGYATVFDALARHGAATAGGGGSLALDGEDGVAPGGRDDQGGAPGPDGAPEPDGPPGPDGAPGPDGSPEPGGGRHG